MKRGAGLGIVGLTVLALAPAPLALAQDASFGCKVLLCATATAPGWSGIPYCVPVMQQLFRDLARGRGWPSCPEGRASGVGFERFEECPAGTAAVEAQGTDGGYVMPAREGRYCADLSKRTWSCSGGHDGCNWQYPMTSRQLRDEPYYVDITVSNNTKRFYFSLRGY